MPRCQNNQLLTATCGPDSGEADDPAVTMSFAAFEMASELQSGGSAPEGEYRLIDLLLTPRDFVDVDNNVGARERIRPLFPSSTLLF